MIASRVKRVRVSTALELADQFGIVWGHKHLQPVSKFLIQKQENRLEVQNTRYL